MAGENYIVVIAAFRVCFNPVSCTGSSPTHVTHSRTNCTRVSALGPWEFIHCNVNWNIAPLINNHSLDALEADK